MTKRAQDPRLQTVSSLFRQGDRAGAEAVLATVLAEQPDDPHANHLRGQLDYGDGAVDTARARFRLAVAGAETIPSYRNSLGVAALALGDVAEAIGAFEAAIALGSRDPLSFVNLGHAKRIAGQVAEARAVVNAALTIHPGHAGALAELAAIEHRGGALVEAEHLYRAALAADPTNLSALHHLGELLIERDRCEEAADCFRRVLALAPATPAAAVGLAMAQQALLDVDGALATLEGLLALVPGDRDALFLQRVILSGQIAGWHIPMINDHERNDAYRAALEATVTPDDVVLEIGTGSGIVAMMAARAGARHVYTCEVSKPLATAAVETVRRNGYHDRVTVIPKKSTALVVGDDLPERATVFVSELINIGMLAPAMLQVLRHAREALCTPDARIIPAAATVYAALIEAPELARVNPVARIDGFDMSHFDRFRSPGYTQIDLGADQHRLLCQPVTALQFDFTRDMPDEHGLSLPLTATATGVCHGVVFWFDLAMADGVTYHSASQARTNHWKQALDFCAVPLPVTAGQALTLSARYDKTRIWFEVTP